jgi:hypothetical protein
MADSPVVAYYEAELKATLQRALREAMNPMLAAAGLPPDWPAGWNWAASPWPAPAAATPADTLQGRTAAHLLARREDPYG